MNARQRFAADLAAATANIRAHRTAELRDAGGHVRDLRSVPTAGFVNHPRVALFDRAQHPDIPVLPLAVSGALSVVLRHVDVPGSVTRPHQCEASAIVRQWALTGSDECNPFGMPRPDGVA